MASVICCRRMATVPSQARFLESRLGRLASYSTPLRRASRAVSTTTRLPHVKGTSAALLRSRVGLNGRDRTKLIQLRCYADRVIQVPQMAESISEGTLKQWSKKVGDFVERDEEIATIETDKIDVAVNAPESGTLKEILANEEATVTVGQDLAKMETGGGPKEDGGAKAASQEPKAPASGDQPTSSDPEPSKESKEPKPKPQEESRSAPPPPSSSPSPPSSPPQEKKSEKPKKDAATEETRPAPPSQSTKQEQTGTGEGLPGNREERRVKMNRMRLRIAERLKQSQNTAASLTTFNEVDMSSLMEFRKLYKDDVLKKTGVKLGFMSAFSRACILAMKDIPAVNASIDGPGSGDTIVYRDYVDISVAVATEKGLVTPVVRNAESLDLVGVERAIAELGKKARDNKLTIEDMAGGTFTISNGGVFGSLMGTPIINLPQTAVLGLHAIKDKPVAVNGRVEIRPMMFLALTYDHRLLDGREAVTFLVKVKDYIEDPRRMLIA